MLQAQGIHKSYGIQIILDDVSLVVNSGDRAALIGPNGCGKSTLLRILAGREEPDRGVVALAPSATVGYLVQGLDFAPGLTIDEAMYGADYQTARREVRRAEAEMESAQNASLEAALAAYASAIERFEALGGYDLEWRAEEVLGHLGLTKLDPGAPVHRLSGGQQTRLGLARLLLAEPSLLLLDEPTNHLDLDALSWLEDFLARYRGAVLIVSHDRVFLDRTVNRVIELSAETHQVREFQGGYSDYVSQRSHERELQWSVWTDQQAEVRRIRQDIARTREHANSVERSTTPRQPGVRRYAKKVMRKALSREKKLERFLDSDERVEKPRAAYQLKLEFGTMPRGGQEVIRVKNLGHTFDGTHWLFRGVNLTLRHGERIALLGPNGSGKSTLIRAVLGEISPAEGITEIGTSVRIGYMPQGQQSLDPEETPMGLILRSRPMSETDARSLLHYFLFAGDEVFVPTRDLSYGQRARLLLARIVVAGANCLILDEPLNHLDIPSRERFEAALDTFPGAVLFTGHDRAFIDRLATGIWSVESGGVRTYVDREEMLRLRRVATG
jgi:ATP-binding cassette subfamily F protein 3